MAWSYKAKLAFQQQIGDALLKLNIRFYWLYGPAVTVAHKSFVIGRLINPGDNLPLSAAVGTGHMWTGV